MATARALTEGDALEKGRRMPTRTGVRLDGIFGRLRKAGLFSVKGRVAIVPAFACGASGGGTRSLGWQALSAIPAAAAMAKRRPALSNPARRNGTGLASTSPP